MFNIAKRVFLVNIRSSKYVWFSMVFPIFLMIVIGAVLTNTFKADTKIKKLTVYYVDNGSKQSSEVFKLVKENKGNLDLQFKEIDSVEAGKNKVRIDEQGFINIDGDTIKIYTNDKDPINTGMLNGLFNGVNNRVSAVIEMFKINPKTAQEIMDNGKNVSEFKTEELSKEKTPSSYDYYGVAELNLIVVYMALYPLSDMTHEKKTNLKARIKLSGLSNFKYYLGVLMGYSALSVIMTLPGYLFSIFALNTNWGSSYILSYLTIIIFSIMALSVGMALGVVLNDDQKATVVLQSIVFPVICFLGGSYINFPDELGNTFQFITGLSPLRWMNRGIFRMAFLNDYSIITTAVLINVSITVVCMIFIMIFSKRKEAM